MFVTYCCYTQNIWNCEHVSIHLELALVQTALPTDTFEGGQLPYAHLAATGSVNFLLLPPMDYSIVRYKLVVTIALCRDPSTRH